MKFGVRDLARDARRKQLSAYAREHLDPHDTPVGSHVENDLAINIETHRARLDAPAHVQNTP
jgi:hypothetical protein